MNNVLRYLFFLLVVRPVTLVVLGLNVRRGHLLPTSGPAIIVSNHNSHLDALTLMTLFGMRRLHLLRPVAAADFFLKNKWLGWFSTQIIGIIPLDRNVSRKEGDPLAKIAAALEQGQIIILFPEGTRGEPEKLQEFRTGVAHLAKRFKDVPISPVFVHGLGKALPRGEALLVPFFCDIFIGEPLHWTGDRASFMEQLNTRIQELSNEAPRPEWN